VKRQRGALALVAAGLVVVSAVACDQSSRPNAARRTSTSPTATGPSGDPTLPSLAARHKPCRWSFGALGGFTGTFSRITRPILNGVRLAIRLANADPQIRCSLELVKADDTGRPAHYVPAARRLLHRERLVACVCGIFSGETLVAGRLVSARRIPFTSMALDPLVDEQGFTTWFRAVASDELHAKADAYYLDEYLHAKDIVMVLDRSSYGADFAKYFEPAAGSLIRETYTLPPHGVGLGSLAKQVADDDPDAVYFAGYVGDAVELIRRLRDLGSSADFLGTDGVLSPDFWKAGDARVGAVATCPCSNVSGIPEAETFAELYDDVYFEKPGAYALDAFDITQVFIDGLRDVDARAPVSKVRRGILSYLRRPQPKPGITKDFDWTPGGAFRDDPAYVWLYRWSDEVNDFVLEGSVEDLVSGSVT
jgi:branched-chain amino acid transport system substrate-binding protein